MGGVVLNGISTQVCVYNSVNWSVAVGNSSSEVLDYHISRNKNILVSFPNCSWVAGKNWSANESIRFQAKIGLWLLDFQA